MSNEFDNPTENFKLECAKSSAVNGEVKICTLYGIIGVEVKSIPSVSVSFYLTTSDAVNNFITEYNGCVFEFNLLRKWAGVWVPYIDTYRGEITSITRVTGEFKETHIEITTTARREDEL